MKINLTESEERTLKYALKVRYNHADDKITCMKNDIRNFFSLGYILAVQFYSDMKSDLESIYQKIFNEDIRKEISK